MADLQAEQDEEGLDPRRVAAILDAVVMRQAEGLRRWGGFCRLNGASG
jgi:hypothetical protein